MNYMETSQLHRNTSDHICYGALNKFAISTPGPASKVKNLERRQSDREVRGRGQPVHFATLSAHNAAAVHLLKAVQTSGASPCLVGDQDTISYYLALPSATTKAGFTQPAADRWRLGSGPSTVVTEKGVEHCKAELLLCPPGHTCHSARKPIALKHPKEGHCNAESITVANTYMRTVTVAHS